VQCDKQWIRRILREEQTLIDAFEGKQPNYVDDYP